MAFRPVPRPPVPKPAPKPAPAPKPIPIPVPRPNPARPPPIIIVPGPNPGQPARPCNTYSGTQTDDPYACPTSGPIPLDGSSSSSRKNTGAIVGGVMGGLLALVALIVGGFVLARWRRRRQEMNDAIAYYSTEPRSITQSKAVDDPNGTGVGIAAAAVGSAGVGAGTGGAGGNTESEQVQARSMALPPAPASPATIVGPFPESRLSDSKEHVVEKEDAKGSASSPSTGRPVTPAGIPLKIPFTSQPLSTVSTLSVNTINDNNNDTTTAAAVNNDSGNIPGPKEEWTPGSSAVPAIVVNIPSSSLASHP